MGRITRVFGVMQKTGIAVMICGMCLQGVPVSALDSEPVIIEPVQQEIIVDEPAQPPEAETIQAIPPEFEEKPSTETQVLEGKPVIKKQSLAAPQRLEQAPEPEPETTPPELIIASVQVVTANKQKYIEIANPRATALTIKNWKVTSTSGTSKKTLATLWGTIQPGMSVVIAQDSYAATDQQTIDVRYSDDEPSALSDEVQIVRADDSVVERMCWGSACGGDGLSAFSSTTTTYERNYDQNAKPVAGTQIQQFTKVANFPVSGGGYQAFVNPCTGIRLNEIAANVETSEQFIELYNPTNDEISLEACHLQTNRSSQTFTFDAVNLPAKKYLVVKINQTLLSLTKTTSGTVFLLSSDMKNEVDSQNYEDLAESTSWAYFIDGWKQTYKITEDDENVWQEFLPCEEGYERNPETERCRKIETEPVLTPCAENQYRSPETNRCRLLGSGSVSLAACAPNQYRNLETNRCRLVSSGGSSLKACAANQVRNPETNRCRLKSAASKGLKPCAKNQVRNPETNRCRKATGSVLGTADFPVEKITDGQNSSLGWVAFAGVGSLATSYGVWEWRRELGKIIAGILKFVTRT